MKNLIFAALLITTAAIAQSAQEEAIILNQEMQFLQESAQNVNSTRPLGEQEDRRISDTPRKELDLERTYFGDDEMDSIRTRTAAPRRKMVRE